MLPHAGRTRPARTWCGARRYTEQIMMGWSSGGAMASAFLDYAHRTGFTTANNTRYSIKGMDLD